MTFCRMNRACLLLLTSYEASEKPLKVICLLTQLVKQLTGCRHVVSSCVDREQVLIVWVAVDVIQFDEVRPGNQPISQSIY